MIPLFVYITPGHNVAGAAIFALASITDFLDGYLARKSGEVTTFGIIIDPIADKFLVIAALIMLVDMQRVAVLVAVVIIVREVLVTSLRMVALARDIVIAAEMGGKLKTGFQIAAVIGLILPWSFAGVPFHTLGTIAVWVALVLALVSGVQYMVIFWRKLAEADASSGTSA
jgi:CDP-diacylglycerol--glycerol-3-phosphate 3-phosphatidyltransferase